jgi:hypothetical protein
VGAGRWLGLATLERVLQRVRIHILASDGHDLRAPRTVAPLVGERDVDALAHHLEHGPPVRLLGRIYDTLRAVDARGQATGGFAQLLERERDIGLEAPPRKPVLDAVCVVVVVVVLVIAVGFAAGLVCSNSGGYLPVRRRRHDHCLQLDVCARLPPGGRCLGLTT